MKVMDYNIHLTQNINQSTRQSPGSVTARSMEKIESFNYESVLMNLDEMKSFLYLIVGARDLTVIDSSGHNGRNINARA